MSVRFMPKPKNLIPAKDWHLQIPEDLAAWYERFLYDEAEQRIPHGAKSALVVSLLRAHKASKES